MEKYDFSSEKGFTENDLKSNSEAWSSIDGDLTFRLDYPLNSDSLVLDVGGFVGKWAQDIYCKHKCKLHVFEPIAHYASIIKRKFSNNPDVMIYDYGLAHIDASPKISIIQEASSLFKRPESDEAQEKIILKKADNVINSILKETSKDKISLMKINIEGAEYLLLEHLIATGMIEKIENIQIQFHIFIKNYEMKRDAIRAKLEKTHKLTYDYPFIWENWQKLQ